MNTTLDFPGKFPVCTNCIVPDKLGSSGFKGRASLIKKKSILQADLQHRQYLTTFEKTLIPFCLLIVCKI